MKKETFHELLAAADFPDLFNEMGWDRPTHKDPLCVSADGREWVFHEAAQKCGFHAYVCPVEDIPASALMRLLDTQLRRYGNDYLAIFTKTGAPLHHHWCVPVKTVEKRELVAVEYTTSDQAAFLHEKLSAITFDLTEEATIVDVVARVHAAFTVNAARITKEFYTTFRRHHENFARFLEGIPLQNIDDRQWYASVMLNRLMFCYFIQKKGFLDLDHQYLGNKLRETQQKQGKDKFYGTFYRRFLMLLFRDGLNSPRHDAAFTATFGRIPYLNGGIFAEHEIEAKYPDLDIKDEAFELLFEFFDKWRWHLDYRITATGRDINPDVLGYIFEQYINDRAKMGAYYTKEDITEYIAKNCIIPFLFDKVMESKSGRHLKPGGPVWQMLKQSGDEYIYPALRKGIDLPLPAEIAIGLTAPEGVALSTPHHLPQSLSPGGKGLPPSDGTGGANATLPADDVTVVPSGDIADIPSTAPLRERRKLWNTPAPAAYALPTEIWRETIARRQRALELRRKIAAGEITAINDFITHNLDIRTFVRNIIEKTDDHLLVRHFYQALREVTILDPTCGSGAFLFAALNILEPLYETCLQRMEEFQRENPNLFKDELAEISAKYRGNRLHFIYKTIILRNLYGVDIMHEATEIAKLRLFLKTVAVVDVDPRHPNLGLDPLPDIDFNIRCGNTLVGFASPNDVKNALTPEGMLGLYDDEYNKVELKASDIATIYRRFKALQLEEAGYNIFTLAKAELRNRLNELSAVMDEALARTAYNIKVDTLFDHKEFERWKNSHQPFHWYAEFYETIVERGGFDVIIGNPPYVEYEQVAHKYSVLNYVTLPCGNLYAMTIERCTKLLSSVGHFGMIVPSSATCTDGYEPLQKLLHRQKHVYVSSYSDQRGKLFDIPHPRLCIILFKRNSVLDRIFSTPYIKLGSGEHRNTVFTRLEYIDVSDYCEPGRIPRYGSVLDESIHKRLSLCKSSLGTALNKTGKHSIYYTRKLSWFVQVIPFVPHIRDERGERRPPSELKELNFTISEYASIAFAVLNSNLFYWFITTGSDCRNLNMREVLGFPLDLNNIPEFFLKELVDCADKLTTRLLETSEYREMQFRGLGTLQIQCLFPKHSKPIIDEIDTVLAAHYGFTEEELDYIINYDIKYRMGGELAAEPGE